jgi:hypothetical protein
MNQIKREKLVDALNRIRKDYHDRIATAIVEFPDKPFHQIAFEEGVSPRSVVDVAKMRGLCRTPTTDEVEANNA